MTFSTLALVLGFLFYPSLSAASQYVLTEEFTKTNFFEEFSFFDLPDPTKGVQRYIPAIEANRESLAGFAHDGVYLGVDWRNVGPDRMSVRLTSDKAWDKGLFVADIAHMPTSSCGVWPAFWLFGPDWPNQGEIDVIEGVNTQESNKVTLHTGPGCHINNEGTMDSTELKETDCNAGDAFMGCTQSTSSNENYGDGFNAIGGGVYAIDWTEQRIAVWFFPRGSIPDNVMSENPDPSTWGPPLAGFNGGEGCSIPQHFVQNSLVFNIALCGEWAGEVWGQNPECTALASTCGDYVAQNPGAFSEAYWLINSVRVFQDV